MIKKRASKKRVSKNDEWRGRLDERTKHLVDTVNEMKKDLKDLPESIDLKFVNLRKCINEKFDKHNHYHINTEKKYTKLFLIISALAIASLIANPEGLVIAAKFIIRLF